MGKCGGIIVPRRKWNHTFNIESNTYGQICLECLAAVGWHVYSGRFNSQLLCKDRGLHYEHINFVDLFLSHIPKKPPRMRMVLRVCSCMRMPAVERSFSLHRHRSHNVQRHYIKFASGPDTSLASGTADKQRSTLPAR